MSESGLTILTLIISLLSLAGTGTAAYFYYQDRIRRQVFWKNQSLSHAQLEEMYGSLYNGLNTINRMQKELAESLEKTRKTLSFGVVKTGVHRYNSAADEVGGNLSFSIALLDEVDSGLVITSLHGRASSRVYCKPVERGTSTITPTDEETQAIKLAKKNWESNLFILNSHH